VHTYQFFFEKIEGILAFHSPSEIFDLIHQSFHGGSHGRVTLYESYIIPSVGYGRPYDVDIGRIF
jgi:hypothetical protein